MSNQTNEIIAEHKQPASNKINWGKVSILFSILAIIIFICAFGYGYFQLSQENVTLGQAVSNLQTQIQHSHGNLSSLQQSVEQLRQSVEQSKKEQQPTAQQDQMATEIYSRLTLIDTQLDQLPLLLAQSPTKVDLQQTPIVQKPGLSWWQIGLERSWQVLRNIVIVRHIDPNEIPLASPEEKTFLYQNLHAQIEAAMWGALHHNVNVYHTSLARAIAWIHRYFIQDASETKNILQELEELQKTNVVPTGVTATVAQ